MHEALLLLLDHSSAALLEATCGVLINLAADPPHAAALLSCGGGEALCRLLLHVLSEEGADVATMPAALLAGKTLCNLCCIAECAPLAPQQHTALLEAISWPQEAVGQGAASRLRAPPAAWPSEADGRTEWVQVADLLSQLLRQPPPTPPPAAVPADDSLEVLEAPQETPAPPQQASQQASVSCSVGTST